MGDIHNPIVHFSPFVVYSRAWSLSSSNLFIVKIFFLGLVEFLKSYLVPSGQVIVEIKSPFKG